ncbi:amidohydrolase family protein [Sphingomonas sp. YR710]|uniref:amidohydrolase family protein n=1 Tax=Sphingomonas sp. YR710 TaxID=1882773 RepID=UPI0015A092B3|nr:amidohydrolase family protein [Sphingomonas sp. YR710]
MSRFVLSIALGALIVFGTSCVQAQPRFAIIDMHFHAERPDAEGPPGGKVCAPYQEWAPRDPGRPIEEYLEWFTLHPTCRTILTAPTESAVLRDRGIAMLKRYNILALAGGDAATVEDFRSQSEGHILPAIGFGQSLDFPSVEGLRKLFSEGKLWAISEITAQYSGIAPDDLRLDPYFALAEELDIPVGIHLGPGPPGTAYFATPEYRASAGDPMRLEAVLIRHPHLRMYAMHAGWPMSDAMIAMLYAHPQLYVDVGILDYAYPERDFYAYLRRLVDAGFEQRIMFGSDNMIWPDAIPIAIRRIQTAPFLTARQKRLILHDNAARFMRIEG